jgi:hypothetical protein
MRRDEDMAASIEAGRRLLDETLAPLGVTLRHLRDKADLEAAFQEPDPRPLVLIYLGHAHAPVRDPTRTVLCLKEGELAVDDLLAMTHAATRYTVLLLDGCESATVDVRRSKVPTAVLSGSPLEVRFPRGQPTALAALLPGALECADVNGNGWVEDLELAHALQAQKGAPVDPGVDPFPRLRRQAWRALPVIPRTRSFGPTCPPAHQLMSDVCRDSTTPGAPGLPPGPLAGSLIRDECELVRAEKQSFFWTSRPFFIFDSSRNSVSPPSGTEVLAGDRDSLRWMAGQLSASEGFELVRTATGVALERLRDGIVMGEVHQERPGDEELRRAGEDLVRRVLLGHWALAEPGLAGTSVWHGGRVGKRLETADGRTFEAQQFVAVPCSGSLSLFGQCFVFPTREGVRP